MVLCPLNKEKWILVGFNKLFLLQSNPSNGSSVRMMNSTANHTQLRRNTLARPRPSVIDDRR